ncbi:hypothetical protein V8C37DRAFT_49455 [Trichoderma ceciliae]
MDDTSILTWVNALPEPASPNATRKRKTISDYHLASPPSSYREADDNSNMISTPQKKRRLESQGAQFDPDPDVTPRPGSRSIPSSSASISASEASSMSRASSTKKQMMSLRLSYIGIECEPLDEDTVPEVAKTLCVVITDIGRGLNILPNALKPMLVDQSINLSRWKYSFKPADEPDNLPGRIPSFEEIKRVLVEATECEKFQHEEASWNHQVHLRLLDSIFKDALGGQYGDFNNISCTSARPHRQFKPIISTAKIIDACIYASLNQDQELKAATAFSSTAPTLSINHTDFQPLQLRPLLLSIETKKPGIEGEKAQLQIGVWHAAQWAFLHWAVGQKLQQKQQLTDEEFKAEKLAALSKLGFIPGIIIHWNRWNLVLSTYNNGKTKLWVELAFGTTKNIREIYAIVAGVRELTAWARDIYLPWFKENVLTLV